MSETPAARVYCTNSAHGYGEHDATCMPPAEPGNAELRLIRAIFGLCPECDRTEEHSHEDAPAGDDTCHICGKREAEPHTSATRSAHHQHYTRHGLVGMCKAPRADEDEPARYIVTWPSGDAYEDRDGVSVFTMDRAKDIRRAIGGTIHEA